MDYMSTVQSIVRKYFDNAIVIDDKLEYGYPPIEKLKDSDINFESLDDLIDTEEKVAPVVDEGNYDKSNLAYNQFVKDGFVTFQYKFIPQHEDLQIKNLENVISNAKLMILDWNIEDAKPESPITAGGIAVKLIQRFVEMQKGLKCVVIYTQEDCNDVLNILKESYEIVNKEKLFFQEKNSEDGCSFFGFVVSKEVSPNEIIGKISEILYQDKCITLHFIDIVGKLEDNLQQALNRYNTPFEKAVYAQFLTSDFTHNEISTFINETLLSDILDSHVLLTDENILITTKKCKFKDIIEDNIDVNKIGELLEIMKGKVKDRIITLLTNKDFINDLGTILGNNYINSIKELNKSLKELIEKYVDADEKTVNRIQKELVLLIVLYDNYLKDNAAFKESFLYESYRFTKLMKFTKDNDTKIRTGSIYKMKDSNNYIICITPFCDTHNPEKVNGIFKFIVGQPTEAKKVCEKQSDNSFIMALPLDSEKKVGFIDWKLYNTISMNEAELNEQYIKVASLRKEYVQKIINLYLSYQSRAGVNELFYKESSFSGYLINVVS